MVSLRVRDFFWPCDAKREIEQGTTERVRKIWMPLEEFVPKCMEEILRGGTHAAVGDAARTWDQFETGKLEIMSRVPH